MVYCIYRVQLLIIQVWEILEQNCIVPLPVKSKLLKVRISFYISKLAVTYWHCNLLVSRAVDKSSVENDNNIAMRACFL